MFNSGPFRVLCGAVLGMIIGTIFYDPNINSYLMKIWIAEYMPDKDFSKIVASDLLIPLSATALGLIVLSACVNQYVNYRQIESARLFRMALELWVMSVCLRGPHVLWASQSLKGFMVDQIYDLLIVLAISFAVGFKRFNRSSPYDYVTKNN